MRIQGKEESGKEVNGEGEDQKRRIHGFTASPSLNQAEIEMSPNPITR